MVGMIFARGGSKGLPRKNLRLLGHRPLLVWAIETAKACPSLHRVIVSTEDSEIAAVAQQHGAEVPFLRPAALAQDDSPEWLAWQHAIRTLEEQDQQRPDIMVSVPATSPFRQSTDVETCIQTLVAGDADGVITVKQAARNPYFNMVAFSDGVDGEVRPVIASAEPIYRRQDAPPVFDMTTAAYAVRTAFVLQAQSLFEGRIGAVVIPDERAVDIDTELDLAFSEFLFSHSIQGES
jgi:N-acylneuraminate cytidylyltransferase